MDSNRDLSRFFKDGRLPFKHIDYYPSRTGRFIINAKVGIFEHLFLIVSECWILKMSNCNDNRNSRSFTWFNCVFLSLNLIELERLWHFYINFHFVNLYFVDYFHNLVAFWLNKILLMRILYEFLDPNVIELEWIWNCSSVLCW